MPFKKGNSGNPMGRPNAVNLTMSNRETNSGSADKLQAGIHKFLEKNMLKVLEDLETPASREKARIFCSLLNYTLPRLTPRSGEVRFEDMSEKQLFCLLKMLQENSLPQVMGK